MTRPLETAAPREIEVKQLDPLTVQLRLGGNWHLNDGLPTADELASHVEVLSAVRRVTFDTTSLRGWDSSLIVLLWGVIEGCRQHQVQVDCSGLPEDVRRLIKLAETGPEQHETPVCSPPRPPGRLARVGNRAIAKWHNAASTVEFVGQLTVAIGRLLTGRARHRVSDFFHEVQRAGADALPIVSLLATVIGMIMAFVGGVTLRTFGATLYVADLVGIATARELGAVMTAIIMAGRTGSAYAAELGSMRVSQEIDALVTMDLPPVEFLVINRLLALSLMLPLLCVYANLLSILGGGLVTANVLGLGFSQYIREIKDSVTLTMFAIGVVKSAVFGVIVAFCGCLYGMRAGRSAAGVGGAATHAVVSSIVWIIVTDGIFAIILYVTGIGGGDYGS